MEKLHWKTLWDAGDGFRWFLTFKTVQNRTNSDYSSVHAHNHKHISFISIN